VVHRWPPQDPCLLFGVLDAKREVRPSAGDQGESQGEGDFGHMVQEPFAHAVRTYAFHRV